MFTYISPYKSCTSPFHFQSREESRKAAAAKRREKKKKKKKEKQMKEISSNASQDQDNQQEDKSPSPTPQSMLSGYNCFVECSNLVKITEGLITSHLGMVVVYALG